MRRMTMTGSCRGPEGLSAGRTPRLTMLPRIRSCQTKRCRAATMLPHSPSPKDPVRSEPIDGKDSANKVKTLPCAEPGHKRQPADIGTQRALLNVTQTMLTATPLR